MSLSLPCPRCAGGLVAVQSSAWTTMGRSGATLWVDEPLYCSSGCALTSQQVERLLLAAYEGRTPSRQLTLWDERAREAGESCELGGTGDWASWPGASSPRT